MSDEDLKVQDGNVIKELVIENDKVFVSGSIKLGLKNYSSIDVDFGVTHVMKEGENASDVADIIFNEQVLPKLKDFVGKLASIGTNMANVIEGNNQNNRKLVG